MLFVLLVFVATASSLATYTATKRLIEKQNTSDGFAQTRLLTRERALPTVQPEAQPKTARDEEFEYYLVCLEGETLNVYVSHGGKEEFLYNREIYKNDLSQEDVEILEAGVKLTSASQLTGFVENFTS